MFHSSFYLLGITLASRLFLALSNLDGHGRLPIIYSRYQVRVSSKPVLWLSLGCLPIWLACTPTTLAILTPPTLTYKKPSQNGTQSKSSGHLASPSKKSSPQSLTKRFQVLPPQDVFRTKKALEMNPIQPKRYHQNRPSLEGQGGKFNQRLGEIPVIRLKPSSSPISNTLPLALAPSKPTRYPFFNFFKPKVKSPDNSQSGTDWKAYLKTAIRKILSMMITNASAGNQWHMMDFSAFTNTSSIKVPTSLSDTEHVFSELVNSDSDEDLTSVLDRIISWAPIGPLVHRAEVDLDFDLKEVADILLISPKESAQRVCSRASNGQFAKFKSSINSQSADNRLPDSPFDERTLFFSTEEKKLIKTPRSLNLKEALQTSQLFRKAFGTWLLALSRRIYPFEDYSWMAIGPISLDTQSREYVTLYAFIFSKFDHDKINSILASALPLS
ncbi:hypothetical protein O181_066265 [Austropuccinia psidii MF-1]|uniref:Uncharacterized protein n=1 Tax=Austropuccinia psidii MF-1 TaxID=1389203 RepID=A0A9Q3EWR4_9BASI|nr:hypothetical protein [Austropuccinia psidii MF-1]